MAVDTCLIPHIHFVCFQVLRVLLGALHSIRVTFAWFLLDPENIYYSDLKVLLDLLLCVLR